MRPEQDREIRQADDIAVRQMEDRRIGTLLKGDVDAVALLLHDDLIHIHGTGRIEDKAAYLKSLRERLIFRSISRSDLKVRTFGDFAVMTGPIDQQLSYRDTGKDNDMRAVATQVWHRADGEWKMVSFHACRRE